MQNSRSAKRFFHRWDHRHALHRRLVRAANFLLRRIPMGAKYALTSRVKQRQIPYSLVGEGDRVVQVGAPFDTLHAGRSRGFHLALAAGRTGKAEIVEPHPVSVAEYRAAAAHFDLSNTTVVQAAVATEESVLQLRFDPDHPATNFIDGVARYSDEEKTRFNASEVRGAPLDDLVSADEALIRVLSVTTNGAEFIALENATRLLQSTEYVSLAGPDRDAYDETLAALGFEFVSFDDRGVTYRRRCGD